MRRSSKHLTRPGIATIELVLVFPLLLFLGTMAFSLGNAHLQRSGAAANARQNAWEQRDNRQSKSVLTVADTGNNEIEERVKRIAKMPQLSGILPAKLAESRNALIADTWTDDNPRVGLAKTFSSDSIELHVTPLRRVAGFSAAAAEGMAMSLNLQKRLLQVDTAAQFARILKLKLMSIELVPTAIEGVGWLGYGFGFGAVLFVDLAIHVPFMSEAAWELRILSRWYD